MFLLASVSASGQSQQQAIDESEPGWYRIYKFKGAKESRKANDRFYSIAQLSIRDSLTNWMQASYLPKAGIGDVQRIVIPEVNLYSPYNAALPQGCGAVAYIWNVVYKAPGKLEQMQGTQTAWTVEANAVPGWPIRDFSTTRQYYFTMPSFEKISVGMEAVKKEQDLSNVANLKPYSTFWLKNIEAGNGTEYVLLSKDNKSPFRKITKGEYLQLLDDAILRAYEKEKKSILEKNGGNQKNIDYFTKYLDEKHAKRITALRAGKSKYKDRLAEIAETSFAQPDVMIENYTDIFEGNDPQSSRYPIYTIDPAVVERCKTDKPQWILSSWNWNPMSIKEKHMHESIINNFNFDYVYNFFFDPAKVKGQLYKPKRSPSQKEIVVVKEKSEAAKKLELDKTIHFFDDYSTTAIGKKPVGWYAKTTGVGAGCMVTSVDGVSGQWALLAGNRIVSTDLKKPLPQNFTLSYDVMVPENFTWGAKGLLMILAKEKTGGVNESFIRLKLRPGSGGANGEAEVETLFPSGYANGTKWLVATGFSNNKKINRVAVSIKKSGEMLQVFINKEKIVDYVKAMPTDMAFNALSFEMGRSDNDVEKYYISNIKITKE